MTGLITFLAALLVGAVATSPVLAVLWLSDRPARADPESKPPESKPQGRHRPTRGRTRATVLIGETR